MAIRTLGVAGIYRGRDNPARGSMQAISGAPIVSEGDRKDRPIQSP
jgi:hypothetical protein